MSPLAPDKEPNRLMAPLRSSAPTFWLNGYLHASADAAITADPHLLRGDGLFETMRAVHGGVIDLELHLARLASSCAALHYPNPSSPEIREAISELLGAAPPPEAILRLTVTASSTLIEVRPMPPTIASRRGGLSIWRFDEARHDTLLSRHKTLGWTANAVHARRHPHGSSSSFEGLWLSPEGHVLEGMSTNIFGVCQRDGKTVVITPPLSLPILPGVTRSRAISQLLGLGLRVEELTFGWDTLLECEEVFLTSATLPVAPALSLELRPCLAGPVTQLVWERLNGVPDRP